MSTILSTGEEVYPSMHWAGGCLPQCMLGYTPWADTLPGQTPPAVKAADGTYPTGMHSCSCYYFWLEEKLLTYENRDVYSRPNVLIYFWYFERHRKGNDICYHRIHSSTSKHRNIGLHFHHCQLKCLARNQFEHYYLRISWGVCV